MSATFKPVRPVRDFLPLLIAPTIWFAHLSILYGTETLICIGPPGGWSTKMGWAAFLATVAALTGMTILLIGLLRPRTSSPRSDESSSWRRRASVTITLLSALGILWTTLPTTILPACVGLST
jgi:hypothetical protein